MLSFNNYSSCNNQKVLFPESMEQKFTGIQKVFTKILPHALMFSTRGFLVPVLLVQDANSAILSHLSLANNITKNCTNGLPCLITFLFSTSPRLICRALFGQTALRTWRLLSHLSGFDARIRINLGYLWQSCIALRHSLQGLVWKLGDSPL